MTETPSTERAELRRANFRELAGYCVEYGSPFTAQLVERMLLDLDAGGPVAELIGDYTGRASGDAFPLRVAGALHAAALSGRDPALAAQYPATRSAFDSDAVWQLARAFLVREHLWVAQFIQSPPQTNEVRRTIALLPAFLAFAQQHDRELDVIELGASAGLNLHWDRYRYETASWSWGPTAGSDVVTVDTDWQGAPPPGLTLHPRVRSRAACDWNPLDLRDPLQRLRLRSYIWADQHERLARFDAAVQVALRSPALVERADAGEWLPRKLAQRAPDRALVVYHSLFLQYPPEATRAAISAAIEDAGARATNEAPLAWLRFEPDVVLGGPTSNFSFIVDLITWPNRQHRVIAITDGHARFVRPMSAIVDTPGIVNAR